MVEPTGHCPYLGLKQNQAIRFASPTPEHRCYAAGQAQEIPQIQPDYQTSYCLSPNHVKCPLYTGSGLPSTPALALEPRGETALAPAGGLGGWLAGLPLRDRLIYLALLALLGVILTVYAVAGVGLLRGENLLPGGPAGAPPPSATVATPSPEPTDEPALAPTDAPTATPTASPRPTRTPRPTATARPSATPTETATPSPTDLPTVESVTPSPEPPTATRRPLPPPTPLPPTNTPSDLVPLPPDTPGPAPEPSSTSPAEPAPEPPAVEPTSEPPAVEPAPEPPAVEPTAAGPPTPQPPPARTEIVIP